MVIMHGLGMMMGIGCLLFVVAGISGLIYRFLMD